MNEFYILLPGQVRGRQLVSRGMKEELGSESRPTSSLLSAPHFESNDPTFLNIFLIYHFIKNFLVFIYFSNFFEGYIYVFFEGGEGREEKRRSNESSIKITF